MNGIKARFLMFGLMTLVAGAGAQTTERHSYPDLNLAIPDGSLSGVSDVRVLASGITVLSAVRVKLHVAGRFNGDLYAYIRQVHAGATNFCVLLNRPGRSTANAAGYKHTGLNVTLDSAAPNDIHLYGSFTNVPSGSPLSGSWQPDGRQVDPLAVLHTSSRTTSLGTFQGSSGSGEWTLFLADLDAGATNMLVGWELELAGATSPPITWPTPADIRYGTLLGAAQLNASAGGVAGTFAYTPPAGTMLNAGLNQILSVTFTPTDTARYSPVTTHVAINVTRAGCLGVVRSSINPELLGQPVTFSLALSAVPPAVGTPSGWVRFKVDGAPVGAPAALVGGVASYTTATLSLGTHTVVAEYPGDMNFTGATNSLAPSQLINLNPADGRALRLTIVALGAGSYGFHLSGVPGRAIVVQYSTSLESPDWRTLTTGMSDDAGLFQCTDTPPGGSESRYYRALYP